MIDIPKLQKLIEGEIYADDQTLDKYSRDASLFEINPVIKTSGKKYVNDESCFSRPGIVAKNKVRESNVTITYCTLEDKTAVTEKFFVKDNFGAIVIQHEFDHLLGKLI